MLVTEQGKDLLLCPVIGSRVTLARNWRGVGCETAYGCDDETASRVSI